MTSRLLSIGQVWKFAINIYTPTKKIFVTRSLHQNLHLACATIWNINEIGIPDAINHLTDKLFVSYFSVFFVVSLHVNIHLFKQ